MRADRFDALSRLAAAGDRPGTRRSLLRALGLGGAAVGLRSAPASAAAPSRPPDRRTARLQTDPSTAIDDLAFELDLDVEAIFRFVRDEVAYDPYAGALRGGLGTLWGLAGNAVDQATLLSELIKAAQVQTRLVVGELSAESAVLLLGTGALDAAATQARAVRLLVPPDRDDELSTLNPAEVAFQAQLPALAEALTASIDRYLVDGVSTVAAALDAAGVSIPKPDISLPDEERLRHIWVQVAHGPDWIDLDPTMPGAEPGQVFASDATPLDAISEDLVHRVSIRLIAEQVASGGLAQTEFLAFEAPASELIGLPISLIHPQPESMEQVGISVGGAIEGFRNFVPALMVGEETVFGLPVTFSTGEGVLGAFGGEAGEGDTLAEWLEVGVVTPSGVRTAIRTVFDRVGEEARAAGPVDPATVPPVDLVDAGDVETSYLPLGGIWALGVVAGAVPASLVDRTPSEEPDVRDLLLALQIYHHTKDVHAARASELAGVRLFVDAPNVTALVQRPIDASDGQATASVGVDLLHRSVSVAPGGASDGAHPLLAAGVLSHAVEQSMMESASLPPLELPVTAFSGVARVFAEAASLGIPTLILSPTDAGASIPDLGAGPRRLIQEALAEGRIVVVPERAVALGGRDRVGWWVVDPATGETRDVMDDAGGSTMTDYALIAIKIAGCIFMFVGLGMTLYFCAQIAATALVGGSSPGAGKGTVGSAAGTTAAGAACAA